MFRFSSYFEGNSPNRIHPLLKECLTLKFIAKSTFLPLKRPLKQPGLRFVAVLLTRYI